MNAQDILSRIDASGPFLRGKYFCLLVQNLLNEYLKKQGKTFKADYRLEGYEFDGFAPDGIDGYEGPTVFEIFYRRIPTGRVREMSDGLRDAIKISGARHGIMICSFNEPIRGLWLEENKDMVVWGRNKVEWLIEQNLEFANSIVRNLFKLEIEKRVKNTNGNWKEDRKRRLDAVKSAYRSGDFSLMLGAGVSRSAELPDWDELLQILYSNMVGQLFNEEGIAEEMLGKITDKFISINKGSALAVARYLKAGLTEEEAQIGFVAAVKKALYSKGNSSSRLIESIRGLCIPKRSGAKVKSVITYNFDSLIEEAFSEVKLEYHTIYRDEVQHGAEELPVYHVHGYIPRSGTMTDDSHIVFSEDAYHKVYSDPYHWSNLVQLSTLRENTCLMVGLSLTDPNLRRLLEIAAQKQSKHIRHFAFLQRLTPEKLNEENDNQLDENIVSKILDKHHVIQERMMESLGIRIIWYENYKEIPTLLDSILS
ncbi:MAG: hypothetical protein HDS68_02335 [Bacteroidales bacterium]|nr:hypothetical protein [Bacteroidales bacterium]